MTTSDGTDDGAKGYGVLGRGTPWVYQDRDGADVSVNSVGVWGLLGSAGDISGVEDEVAGNFGQTASAAIAGRNTQASGGHAVYGEHRPFLSPATTFGCLAATDRSGQPAGVYGESDHQGVIGIATSGGQGVIGKSSTGVGLLGESQDFEGVRGISHNRHHGAVVGICDSVLFAISTALFGGLPQGVLVLATDNPKVVCELGEHDNLRAPEDSPGQSVCTPAAGFNWTF